MTATTQAQPAPTPVLAWTVPDLRPRQRLRQDRPRFAPGDASSSPGPLGLILIGVSRAIAAEFDTPESRLEMSEPRRRRAADPPGPGRPGRQRRDPRRLPPVQVRRRSSRWFSACGRSSRCRGRSPRNRAAAAWSSSPRPADRGAGSRSRSCPATSRIGLSSCSRSRSSSIAIAGNASRPCPATRSRSHRRPATRSGSA